MLSSLLHARFQDAAIVSHVAFSRHVSNVWQCVTPCSTFRPLGTKLSRVKLVQHVSCVQVENFPRRSLEALAGQLYYFCHSPRRSLASTTFGLASPSIPGLYVMPLLLLD